MEAQFEQLLAWVGDHPGLAYLTIFAVAMGESTAIVGLIVPGVVLLLATGALITTGAIDFWPAFGAAVAGAILGDGLSYAVGRHFNERLCGIWPFSRYPESLAHGVDFFDRYGAWSVVIGRFVGPSRAFVPLVAGMLRMSARRFYAANIASAIAQNLTYFIPGMVLGASLKLAAEAAVRLAILGLFLVAALWLTFWFAHHLYRLLAPHASAWVQGLLRWSDLHPTMGRIAQALADPAHPDARALTGLAFLLILAALILGASTGLALIGPPDLGLDRLALDLGQSLHTPLGDRLMVGLATLGAFTVALPVALCVHAWLRWRRQARHAYYWLAAAAFPLAATALLGVVLAVPRPALGLQLPWPWSFPSGPVLVATSVYGFLAVALARGLVEPLRWVPYALATTAVTAVAAARVYLGAEWFTGVLASGGLGLLWVAALGLGYHRHNRSDPHPGALAAVAALGLAAGLGLHHWVGGERELARLTPAPHRETVTRTAWLETAWAQIPNRREDLSQRHAHPLTIQYAGNPAHLRATLAEHGWHHARMLNWDNALRLLSPSLPLAELPVIPQVHDGRQESLVLTRTMNDDQREVLRLWPTRLRLDDGAPLWVGNVSRQHKDILLNLINLPATDPRGFTLPETFVGDLEGLPSRPAPDGGPLLIEAPATGAD